MRFVLLAPNREPVLSHFPCYEGRLAKQSQDERFPSFFACLFPFRETSRRKKESLNVLTCSGSPSYGREP